MKAHITLTLVVCLLAAAFVQAGDRGEPTAGHKKMLEWCGEATITGKTYTTPLGPGHVLKGTWIGKPILHGFAVEGVYHYEGKGPSGERQAKEIISHDPVTGKYHYAFYADNGYVELAPFTVEGTVAAWEGTSLKAGKRYKFRGSDTDLPDGNGFLRREEISIDGQPWQPLMEARFVFGEGTENREKVAAELLALNKRASQAYIDGDVDFLDRVYAEEFVGLYMLEGQPAEMVVTKKDMLSGLESGQIDIISTDDSNLVARVSDDGQAVALMGWVDISIKLNGKQDRQKHWGTVTWVKRPSGWKCVGEHGIIVSSDATNDTNPSKTERNKAVLHRVFDDVFNGRNVDTIDEIYHEDFVSHDFGHPDSVGIEAQKRMVASIDKTIPDYHEHLQEMVVEGDLAACRWISTGTFTKWDVSLRTPCLSLYRFQDGKIIEQWLSFSERPQELINKAVVRRLADVLNRGDLTAFKALHAPDFRYYGPAGGEPQTRDDLTEGNRQFRAAFPDLNVTIEDIIADGDKVAARIGWRGTHQGDYQGISPTGKKMTSESMVLIRLANGKFVEGREQSDELSLRQQLGADARK